MDEVVPGVLHWTARHPDIGMDVSSYLVTDAALAVDPLLPEGKDRDWFEHPVALVAVTICLHTRSIREIGATVRAPQAGLHRWEGRDMDAVGYGDGDQLAPGVRALELGAIAPDDFMLHVEAGPGVLMIGDGLLNRGEIRFMPDSLMDEPAKVKRATVKRLKAVLEEFEFDALTFAHGDPIPAGGRAALERFVDSH